MSKTEAVKKRGFDAFIRHCNGETQTSIAKDYGVGNHRISQDFHSTQREVRCYIEAMNKNNEERKKTVLDRIGMPEEVVVNQAVPAFHKKYPRYFD